MLQWRQDDLAERSRIAKKSIADFERGKSGNPHERTWKAIEATLKASGIEFLPAGESGEGVRFRSAMPRLLFRRDEIEERQWVAFAFDYRDVRRIGFIDFQALARIALDNSGPMEIFDRDRDRILLCAADMVDAGHVDADGRVMIRPSDMERVEFDPPEVRNADD